MLRRICHNYFILDASALYRLATLLRASFSIRGLQRKRLLFQFICAIALRGRKCCLYSDLNGVS